MPEITLGSYVLDNPTGCKGFVVEIRRRINCEPKAIVHVMGGLGGFVTFLAARVAEHDAAKNEFFFDVKDLEVISGGVCPVCGKEYPCQK